MHMHPGKCMLSLNGTPFRPSRTAPCEETPSMNLVLWLPALFALGLVGMAACGAFLEACEKI